MYKFEKLDSMDIAGNHLYSCTTETSSIVRVHLKTREGVRDIGRVAYDKNNIMVYQKDITLKHIFKKNDSIGFCYELIKHFDPEVICVRIQEERLIYRISKATFEAFKDFLFFKKVGFEKQVFVERKYFSKESY